MADHGQEVGVARLPESILSVPATHQIAEDFYDFAATGRCWRNAITQDEVDALIEAGRLKDFTSRFVPGKGWAKLDPPAVVTAEQVNAAQARGLLHGAHDAINRHILVETRAKRLGVYGMCEACAGKGAYWEPPEAEQWAEDWEQIEPRKGDGYQLWETTSEGSPVSPVFATPEELARWLTENGATTFGPDTAPYETWLAFIRGPGWAPSMIGSERGVMSGVDAVAEHAEQKS